MRPLAGTPDSKIPSWGRDSVHAALAAPPVVGRFAKGMMVEQIEREYTEFVPDERIVSKAHAKVRFAGRTKEVPNGPIFTWLFEAKDGDTKLTFVILEEDLGWWQNLLESVSAVVVAKTMHGMLAAIKNGVESQSSAA